MKVLVVILNKDNAEGLKETLSSLAQQVNLTLCKDFDVLIMDGLSKDGSEAVAEDFRRRYECIKFKKQVFPGGVGAARVEAVKYALENGYEAVIWGDSENTYSKDYVSKFIACVDSNDCLIFSGCSKVKHESIWSRFFYWYHAYHHLFSYVRRKHAPGNNKLVLTKAYEIAVYPAISRSDDFFFSLSVNGSKICHCPDAVVYISVPKTFRDVVAWQRNRVKGLVEGSLLNGRSMPPDFIPWFLFLLSPLFLLLYHLTSPYVLIGPFLQLFTWFIDSTAVLLTLGMLVKLEILAKNNYERYKPLQSLLGLAGMFLHAFFTTYYTLKYVKLLRSRKDEIVLKDRKVKEYFGFLK